MPYKNQEDKKAHSVLYYEANKERLIPRINECALKRRLDKPEKYLFNVAKQRARKFGKEFDIDIADITIPSHCPVLGIPLFFSKGGRTDNSPSLDRKDNSRGYIKNNVNVISWRANLMKKAYTTDEVEKLLKYMKE